MPGSGNIGSTKAITSHQQHQAEAPKTKKGRLGFRNLFPVSGRRLVQLARSLGGLKPGSALITSRQVSAQPPAGSTIPRSNAISAPNKQAALQQAAARTSDKPSPPISKTTHTTSQKKTHSPRRPAPPPPDLKAGAKEAARPKESPPLPSHTSTISTEPNVKGVKDFTSKEIDGLMDGLDFGDDALEKLAKDPDVLKHQHSHQSKKAREPAQQSRFTPSRQTAQALKKNAPKASQRLVDPKPEALRRLEAESRKSSARLQKEIENLPTPPTDIPKPSKKKPALSRPMSGKEKAGVLPEDYGRLSKYIGHISTTKDLVETWNALTHLAIAGRISSLELSTLKDQFQNQLRAVAQDPDQAEQITQKMIETMVKGAGKQKKIGLDIHEQKRSTQDLHARRRNLRP